MLEGINDVLTWFCLNHPNARFCRTLVLSGFTLSHIEQSSTALIEEANTRFFAMLKLGEFGMLGEYQPSSRTNETVRRFGTDCTNTFLLMQTYEESLAEVQSKTATNSHSCILSGGCWKKMRLPFLHFVHTHTHTVFGHIIAVYMHVAFVVSRLRGMFRRLLISSLNWCLKNAVTKHF